MVRRRRNQRDAGHAMPQLRNQRRYFVSRQLAAFTRLGTLGHFNFQFLRAGQILRRDPKPSRGNLLDGRIRILAVRSHFEPRGVFATFT